MVEGWVRFAPGEIERFLPTAAMQIAASRAEPGCLSYGYARDLLEPDLLRISEHWADEAALAAHFRTPHVAEFNRVFATLSIVAANVNIYTADKVRALITR